MKLIEELDTSIKKDIIIDGLMRSKGVYLLVSKPKVGKSMLALQLSYCLTNELPFLRHKVTLSPVLYISTESDFGQLQDRYKTLDLVPKKDSLFIIDRDGKPNISIFNHEWEIADFAGDKKANKLVIIDMLKDMDAIHYQKWRTEMMKANISNSYKNEIQKFLKIVINWDVKTYGFNMNKFYGRMEPFTSASDIKKEMDFYTLEEFNQFISSAPNLQIKCMYETLYYCGLRRGEARGLKWKDINWIDKRLSVTKQAVTNGSESSTIYELTKPKTEKSNRILPIAEILFIDLKQLYEEQKQFSDFNDNWFIFGGFIPITFYQMRHKNIEIAKDAKIKRIRLHDFRHSCASLLINNNENIAVVSQFLGHASIEETLDTYTHMFKDKLYDAVNTINKLIYPAPSI